MLRGILTGAVSLDYAEHRHPLWIAEIEGAEANREKTPAEESAGPEDVPDPAEAVAETHADALSADRETATPEAGASSEQKG
jgi:hypothetical protein